VSFPTFPAGGSARGSKILAEADDEAVGILMAGAGLTFVYELPIFVSEIDCELSTVSYPRSRRGGDGGAA
jgi:hypothetical protein